MQILEHPVLKAFFRAHSNHASGPAPVAVFDCDGTVIKGDVGEAMFYRQIEHFHFRQSPAEVWMDHPERALIDTLYRKLEGLGERERLTSAAFGPFAELLISWYVDQIAAGAVVKACADIVRLFAGFTPEEMKTLASDNFAAGCAAPLSERMLGNRSVPLGIRYLREGRDLAEEMIRRGFQVWAVSGSNRWSVEPVFAALGVPSSRVIGIEMEIRDGVLTDRQVEPVPIREGKVKALRLRTPAVPVLAASDSKNDLPLFLAATEVRVRINSRSRDTDDFFRSSGMERDSRWVLVEQPETLHA
jgi:phosphoserine phosphatase